MYGDYGYMEEGRLGKPYDLGLLRRLARFALPYAKLLMAAIGITLIATLMDLAVPYFSKIAIDRYILSSWYPLQTNRMPGKSASVLLRRHGPLLEKGREPGTFFISHEGLKKLDPAELHDYRKRGILGGERFYRLEKESHLPELQARLGGTHELENGALMVPYGLLEQSPREDLEKIRRHDLRGVTLVALVFLLLVFLSMGLGYAEHYLLELSGQRIMQDIRMELFRRMQSQSLSFYDRNPLGRLVTRVTNDVENLNEMFRSVSVTLFKDLFLLAGIVIVLLYMNWRLALLSLVLLPVIFALTFLFSSMAREAFRKLRTTVSQINTFLQERITGMRVIQLFTREEFQMGVFVRLNRKNYRAGMEQIRVFAVFMPLMELFSSFAVGLLVWYGGGKVIQEQLTLGSLVAFIGYIQMFFKPVRDISEKYSILQSAMASTERIFQFMDQREQIPEPEFPVTPEHVRGHLVFDRVSFGYDQDKPVVQDISFEVKPGQTVALVGPTGSGKTTLVNLAERFYDPQRGAIFLDGLDIRNWPSKTLRGQMGLCMQDVFVFGGNLGANISLGRLDLDSKAIEEAALSAGALPFIRRLPQGFAQEIGEGGSTLSAGERQLLSFARALAAKPRMLILDEATSSVDPETERLIQETLTRMMTQRTTLVIAHRLSTILDADRILVLHHGRIVEQGTHEELMALGGTYYRLSRLLEG